jgi:PIF1 helicase.
LSDKQRTSIRIKLQHVKLIVIDKISMVSSKLLLNIHKRLCEIFGVVNEKLFAGKSILACGDLYQLPPVMARPVFDTEGLLISVLNL